MVFLPQWQKFRSLKPPDGRIEIDYSNDLAQGLKRLVFFEKFAAYDVVQQEFPSDQTGALLYTPYLDQRICQDNNNSAVVFPIDDPPTGFTVSLNVATGANAQRMGGLGSSGGNQGYVDFFVTASGQPRCQVADDGGSNRITARSTVVSPNANEFSLFTMRELTGDDGNFDFILNGGQDLDNNNQGLADPILSHVCIGGSYRNGVFSNTTGNGWNSFLAYHAKYVTDGDLREFYNFPWQVVKKWNLYWDFAQLLSSGVIVDADKIINFDFVSSVQSDQNVLPEWVAHVANIDQIIAIENLQSSGLDATLLFDLLAQVNADKPIASDWLSQTYSDKQSLIEWLSNVAVDAIQNIEWGQVILADSAVMYEFLTGLLADKTILADWTGSVAVNSDHTLPIEWLLQANSDQLLLVSWLSRITTSAIMATDWTGGVATDKTLLMESLQGALSDQVLLLEWAGSLGVSSDHTVLIEWLLDLQSDHQVVSEWLTSVVVDAQSNIEWLQVLSADRQILVENLQGTTSDRFLPIEWSGGLVVNADQTLPIEWVNQINSDKQLLIDHLNGVVFDGPIPIEFNQGLVADQIGVIEWLASLGVDQTMLMEWGGAVVVNSDQIMPIEWAAEGGVFIEGNVNIFKVSPRGVVWRVKARGVSWNVRKR